MAANTKPLTYTTKTQALSNHLAAMARRMGPGTRLPTMAQLALDLGVSVMTLNRAFSELEAQGIVVRRQGSGTYVAEKLSQTATALVYDRDVFGPNASPFCALLLHEATRQAGENGEKFGLFVCAPDSATPVPPDLEEAIKTRRLAGVLFAGESNPAALQWLLDQKIPLVALSYAPVAPYRVRIDHAQTAYLGARELARRGCKRIALWIPAGVGIGPAQPDADFEELAAFRRALDESGVAYEGDLVFNLDQLGAQVPDMPVQSNREQGQNAAHAVFGGARDSWPDGVVCLDDVFTLGALAEMKKLDIEVGRDVQMATHTNRGSQLLFGLGEGLVLLEVDPARVAAAMAEMLESLLRGEELDSPVISVPPELSAP